MRISGRDWNKVYCAGTVDSDDTVTDEGGRRCPRRKRATLVQSRFRIGEYKSGLD